MKEITLKIKVNKPVSEVFEFTLDPKNTPRWIDSIELEEVSNWPAGVGTEYRNKGKDGHWSTYTLVEIKPGKTFVLSKDDNNYKVQYKFIPIDESSCEFEYHEWVEHGELDDPFEQENLKQLKEVLESH